MTKKSAMSEFRSRSTAATDLAATRDSHPRDGGRRPRSRPPANALCRSRCRDCRRGFGVTLVEAIPADRLSPSRTWYARRMCSMSWAATLSANRRLNAAHRLVRRRGRSGVSRRTFSPGLHMTTSPRRDPYMFDPHASIHEVSARIRERTLSPAIVVDACLARIEALNPRLNAFITVTADAARVAANVAESELRAGRWRGPLHGVPIALKDFYDTAGIKTTAAFERFANRIPAKDAEVVARLKEAGAIVIGKTNMDTLGMATTGIVSFFGPVKNAWSADYIPGGSSSGSAAAVATGMCYATVDTDAIGSCRLPAACCGVVGFKGTYGLISAQGILAGESPPDELIVWFGHPAVTTRQLQIQLSLWTP